MNSDDDVVKFGEESRPDDSACEQDALKLNSKLAGDPPVVNDDQIDQNRPSNEPGVNAENASESKAKENGLSGDGSIGYDPSKGDFNIVIEDSNRAVKQTKLETLKAMLDNARLDRVLRNEIVRIYCSPESGWELSVSQEFNVIVEFRAGLISFDGAVYRTKIIHDQLKGIAEPLGIDVNLGALPSQLAHALFVYHFACPWHKKYQSDHDREIGNFINMDVDLLKTDGVVAPRQLLRQAGVPEDKIPDTFGSIALLDIKPFVHKSWSSLSYEERLEKYAEGDENFAKKVGTSVQAIPSWTIAKTLLQAEVHLAYHKSPLAMTFFSHVLGNGNGIFNWMSSTNIFLPKSATETLSNTGRRGHTENIWRKFMSRYLDRTLITQDSVLAKALLRVPEVTSTLEAEGISLESAETAFSFVHTIMRCPDSHPKLMTKLNALMKTKSYRFKEPKEPKEPKYLSGDDDFIANYIVSTLEGSVVEATTTDLFQHWESPSSVQGWLYGLPGFKARFDKFRWPRIRHIISFLINHPYICHPTHSPKEIAEAVVEHVGVDALLDSCACCRDLAGLIEHVEDATFSNIQFTVVGAGRRSWRVGGDAKYIDVMEARRYKVDEMWCRKLKAMLLDGSDLGGLFVAKMSIAFAHEKICKDAVVQGKFVTYSTPPDEIVDAVLALIDHDDIFEWETTEDMVKSVNSNRIELTKSRRMTVAQQQTVSAGDLKKYSKITGNNSEYALSLYVYNKAKTIVSKKKSKQKWSLAGFFTVQKKK